MSTSTPIRVLIHGANGRMGRAVRRLVADDARFAVVGAVSGQTPVERVVEGVPFFAASELPGVPDFDVAIDFSAAAAFDGILAECVRRGKPLVSGTTGLGEPQQVALHDASSTIALLWASNFSLGVAVLWQLVAQAAAALQGWDCDIVEFHHTKKQDAPSGTALTLGDAAQANGASPHYASLRAGDIVGEHMVHFTGMGERVELIHRATDRDIFARGALHAAAWLSRVKRPGVYGMADVLVLPAGPGHQHLPAIEPALQQPEARIHSVSQA